MSIDRARFYIEDCESGWHALHMNETAAKNVIEVLRRYGNEFTGRVADDIERVLPAQTTEYLCVGGFRHGAKVNLEIGVTEYRFPVEVKTGVNDTAPPQKEVLKQDVYLLVTIVVQGKFMKVLAFNRRQSY